MSDQQAFHRQQGQLSRCQSAYDNMEPPEYYEDDEGLDDDQIDWKLENAIEREENRKRGE